MSETIPQSTEIGSPAELRDGFPTIVQAMEEASAMEEISDGRWRSTTKRRLSLFGREDTKIWVERTGSMMGGDLLSVRQRYHSVVDLPISSINVSVDQTIQIVEGAISNRDSSVASIIETSIPGILIDPDLRESAFKILVVSGYDQTLEGKRSFNQIVLSEISDKGAVLAQVTNTMRGMHMGLVTEDDFNQDRIQNWGIISNIDEVSEIVVPSVSIPVGTSGSLTIAKFSEPFGGFPSIVSENIKNIHTQEPKSLVHFLIEYR